MEFQGLDCMRVIMEVMKDVMEGTDSFEFNVFWPDLGVIHLKLKSDGLYNLIRSFANVAHTTFVKRLNEMVSDDEETSLNDDTLSGASDDEDPFKEKDGEDYL